MASEVLSTKRRKALWPTWDNLVILQSYKCEILTEETLRSTLTYIMWKSNIETEVKEMWCEYIDGNELDLDTVKF